MIPGIPEGGITMTKRTNSVKNNKFYEARNGHVVRVFSYNGRMMSIKELRMKFPDMPSDPTFFNRIDIQGLSVEEAIQPKSYKTGFITITAPNGKKYRSVDAMCKAYGINDNVYKYRIAKGLSMEDALSPKLVRDHHGDGYASQKEMAEAYGLTGSAYYNRRKSGMSVKEALETENCYTDHLGNKYDTLEAMLDVYHITKSMWSHRKALGWSVEDILTKQKRKITSYYVLGKEYKTKQSLIREFGIKEVTFDKRLKSGMTPEEAVTTPLRGTSNQKPSTVCYDPYGKQFPSKRAMDMAYGQTYERVMCRMECGWTLKEALEIPKGGSRKAA